MKVFELIWKWSWLVTLPVVCIFLYWGGVTAERFYTFGVRYNPAPIPYPLHETGEKVFYGLFRKAELAVSDPLGTLHKEPGDLKAINLFVPESSLADLNSNLPHSGFKYIKGSLMNGDKLQKIKFRYRGDFVYHWGDEKKSLRVKTSKDKLFDGVRTFNLLGTKQLETHFGSLLAKELGLISPRTDLVEVTLNGKLLGVHAYVEQLEELTIRNNGHVPGDLYAGELMAKDAYREITSKVFDHPHLWKKISTNNHYPDESRIPLERLLALVKNSDSEQAQKELSKLLDVQAWGAMAAFETLTQSFHYDNAHNWRLYYDPMKSRFYPVIWDSAAWLWTLKRNERAQLDVMPSVMHQLLFKNADILRARAQALEAFFKEGKDKVFLEKMKQHLPGLKRATLRDPLLTQTSDAEVWKIDEFTEFVKKVFFDVRQGYLENKEPLKYAFGKVDSSDFRISFSVSGRVPVSKLRLSFANTIDRPLTGLLGYKVSEEKIEKDISGAISVSGATVDIEKTLVARHQQISVGDDSLKKKRLQVEPAYYELTLNGLNSSNQLTSVLVDYGDGEMISAEHVAALDETPFVDLYNIVNPQPVEVPMVWQGVVDINDITEIHQPLIIEPGTVIRFSPGASLIVRDRLSAEGTSAQPILFVPLHDGQKPWGTVSLVGKGVKGSRLKHVKFNGGSGLKADLFEYTAMLSIHDAKDIVVENCTFRDSKITDDMVHVVYSEVRFSDCLFERSLMDALDIDISDAIIERCHFIRSGNDAIDLMTSTVVVVDTLIENGGDKAVSVGEGAHLLAINNVFRNNVIGVQAKDGSDAAIYNTTLDGNGQALDAYKKNWRYDDGGEIYLYKSRLVGNKKQITADKKSRIHVYDSYIDKSVEVTKKSVKLADTVDNNDGEKSREPTLTRNKKEILDTLE